jgi:hypothetical protein
VQSVAEQSPRRHVQRAGEPGNLINRKRVPAILSPRDRLVVDPAQLSELHLRQTPLSAQRSQASADIPPVSLDPRQEIVICGHPSTLQAP